MNGLRSGQINKINKIKGGDAKKKEKRQPFRLSSKKTKKEIQFPSKKFEARSISSPSHETGGNAAHQVRQEGEGFEDTASVAEAAQPFGKGLGLRGHVGH